MASTAPALIQRANNVIAVSSLIPMVIGILIYKGAITEIILIQSAILFFPFTVGTWLGAHSFTLASPIIFRKIVLVLLIIIGIFALGL
jgi:hypothetical protein